jgi:hypothetical protein
VLRWLAQVANVRVHGETERVPAQVLQEERPKLQPLPAPYRGAVGPARPRKVAPEPASAVVPLPARAQIELPAQHDLSIYDALLAEAA